MGTCHTVTYKNQGEGDVTDPFYIGFDCGSTNHDKLGNTHEITQTIEAGKTYYLESSDDISPTTNYNTRCAVYADQYLPFGYADYLSNKIDESNEDNNIYTEMISIKLKTPDIWVKEVSLNEKWNYLTIKYCNGDFGYTMQPGGAYAWPDGFLMKVTINNITDDNADTDIDYKTPYELFSDNNLKHVFFVPDDGYCGEGNYDLEIFNTDTNKIQSATIEVDWDNNIQETPSGEKNNIKTFYFNDGKAVVSELNPAPEQISSCVVLWSCGSWSSCINGSQTRTCFDENNCGNTNSRPALSQNCQTEQKTKPISTIKKDGSPIQVNNKSMYSNLKGKIILKVEDAGKAYYINPKTETMHYLGRPDDAFFIMREQGIGITIINIEKIPIGLNNLTGNDSDGDGLPDLFEDAIGIDKNNPDTDGDGYSDKNELIANFNPKDDGLLNYDLSFANAQKGKIFLQVEGNGEAWYVNPEDGKRYFLGRPADAFNVMRNLSLGISNENFNSL